MFVLLVVTKSYLLNSLFGTRLKKTLLSLAKEARDGQALGCFLKHPIRHIKFQLETKKVDSKGSKYSP